MTERQLRFKDTFRRFLVLLFCFGVPCLAGLAGASSLQAQEGGPDIPQELREVPILFSADEVTHDGALGIVTARGNVEINQGGRTVMADTVNYNQRTGVVTASGNVRLLELDGTVYFAEFVELSDDLREGFIRDIGVLLTDKTRIAAASGTRRDGRVTVFRKAVFSPCELCREDPSKPPLWQLKADEVIHDQEERSADLSRRVSGVLRRPRRLHAILQAPRSDGRSPIGLPRADVRVFLGLGSDGRDPLLLEYRPG